MRKMVFILWMILFALQIPSVLALGTNKKLTLKIEFYSKPNGSIYDHPLHVKKTITLDPNQDKNTIIMTESKIENNFPITLSMLVKPIEITKKEVDLRFNLLQYGFNQRGSVISQPRIILLNGQSAEMKNELYTLKVKAQWV